MSMVTRLDALRYLLSLNSEKFNRDDFKRCRTILEISQSYFANQLGVSYACITALERKSGVTHKPSLKTIKLMRAFAQKELEKEEKKDVGFSTKEKVAIPAPRNEASNAIEFPQEFQIKVALISPAEYELFLQVCEKQEKIIPLYAPLNVDFLKGIKPQEIFYSNAFGNQETVEKVKKEVNSKLISLESYLKEEHPNGIFLSTYNGDILSHKKFIYKTGAGPADGIPTKFFLVAKGETIKIVLDRCQNDYSISFEGGSGTVRLFLKIVLVFHNGETKEFSGQEIDDGNAKISYEKALNISDIHLLEKQL